ncbi:hypothetical protein LSAT2_009982 [Lamellibrachia satsuma]|nr:hypothetical protein LSAT2_009982 [Lamellibrachia satsuma]
MVVRVFLLLGLARVALCRDDQLPPTEIIDVYKTTPWAERCKCGPIDYCSGGDVESPRTVSAPGARHASEISLVK